MRIAIIGPYFWPQVYGIEKLMYAHARYLAGRGHDVHVVTSRLTFPDGINRSLPAFEEHSGFSIWRLPVVLRAAPPLISYPSRGGLVISGLKRLLTKIAPGIVHAHNIGAGAWALGGALYAKRAQIPFFYSPHYHAGNMKFDRIRKALPRALNYVPLTTATKIYHCTSLVYDEFAADYPYAPRETLTVLRNGVEPIGRVSQSIVDECRVKLLFVGRVDDVRKGFAVLEKALDSLSADVRDRCVLTVVGLISDKTRRRLEATHSIQVRVLGPVSEPDLERAYANADVFAMPSYYEGFGMPYIEAMRYGIPVIGTISGGTPEVVPPGTGFLVPPGDHKALGRVLEDVINDEGLRLMVGSAGREWSKRFHWQAIVDTLEEDYFNATQALAASR